MEKGVPGEQIDMRRRELRGSCWTASAVIPVANDRHQSVERGACWFAGTDIPFLPEDSAFELAEACATSRREALAPPQRRQAASTNAMMDVDGLLDGRVTGASRRLREVDNRATALGLDLHRTNQSGYEDRASDADGEGAGAKRHAGRLASGGFRPCT